MAEPSTTSVPHSNDSIPSVTPPPPNPDRPDDGPPPMIMKKRRSGRKGKGKKVVVASPEHSTHDAEQEETAAVMLVRQNLNATGGEEGEILPHIEEPVEETTRERGTTRTTGEMEEAPERHRTDDSATSSHSQSAIPLHGSTEEFEPPEGFLNDALQPDDQERFDGYFARRKTCPVIYVDLEHLEKELQLNLNAFLHQYEPWIGTHLQYSPSVVRTFYCNLKELVDLDKDGDGECMLETTVRGKRFELCAGKINEWLGIGEPPVDGFVQRSDNEVLSVLMPEGDRKMLNFPPSSMSEERRILWYIYSRCIVNKGNNFTSFTRRDYGLFASFVAKDKRNIGVMIMKELRAWLAHALGPTSLPFPHIVSLFLTSNKIWYLDKGDEVVSVPKFGRTQLAKMGLPVPTTDGERQVKVRRKRSRTELMDEVQSTRAATPEPPASIEQVVNNAVRQALGTILSSTQHMMEQQAIQIERLGKLIEEGNTATMEQLRKLSDRVQAIEALVPTSDPQPSPSNHPAPHIFQPTSSPPIDAVPHPFTHDISPKLPSPPVSSGHASPSDNYRFSSSPVPSDLIIDQVVTAVSAENEQGKSEERIS